MKLMILFLGIILFGCASRKNLPEVPEKPLKVEMPTSIEAKQVAVQSGTPRVVEIIFVRGKSNLAPKYEKYIATLVEQAKQAGAIESVQVVVWADQEYPIKGKSELSADQQILAKNRGEFLKKVLQKYDVDDVVIVNMTERPDSLQRFLQTKDYRIKNALEEVGLPGTDENSAAKAGHAIVMVLLK